MPVPKKRHSNTRTLRRRANWRVAAPSLSTCPDCGGAVRPYHVCPACGHYRGRVVLEIKEKKKGK